MGRIDADANSFGDGFRIAAPQPGSRCEVWKPFAALCIETMAGRAVIAEQRAAGLAHDCHQLWIALNGLIALRFDPSCPGLALECRLFKLFRDGGALVDSQ